MAITIESEIWQLPRWFYAFILGCCIAAVYGRVYSILKRSGIRNSSPIHIDSSGISFLNLPASFISFQRRFLFAYFLQSAAGALQSMYGEVLYGHHGFGREQMALLFAYGHFAALLFGTLLGLFSDFMGRKKASLICCSLYISSSFAKQSSNYYCILFGVSATATASFLASCTFETWLVAEHEKLGFRQDWLTDTFLKMTYGEAASALGSAALANFLVNGMFSQYILFPLVAGSFFAVFCALLIAKGWEENLICFKFKLSKSAFPFAYYMAVKNVIDRKLLLLAWTQACTDFALTVFWFLWTPTIIADGREVNVNTIYPCLMGSIMFGSVAASWLMCGPSFKRPEAYLVTCFSLASFSLALPAYDYQEVGVLVTLFCLFSFSVGIILPSLARLRSIYVPTDLRSFLICLSRIPSSIAIIFILIRGGIYHEIENSTILMSSAVGLASAATSIHFLNRWCLHTNEKAASERP